MARVGSFDHSWIGNDAARVQIDVKDPVAIFQILRAPRGLGLARAWVSGQVDISGDISLLTGLENALTSPKLAMRLVETALRLLPKTGPGVLGQTGPTSIEFRGRPGRHSVKADQREIDFHYSLPARYYSHVLGSSMTYSCGIFPNAVATLDQAQSNKHSIVERKLGLTTDSLLLDVGCGWGGLLAHAASHVGCRTIGVTASSGQYTFLASRVDGRRTMILYGDYRDVLPVRGVTSVASIGMYEHVGAAQSLEFFRRIRRTLPAGGRFLNQAIVHCTKSSKFRRNGFTQRYIFPNAHVLSLSHQLRDIQRAGMSVLAVETYGSHYASTLAHWRSNLEVNWHDCVALVGEPTARAWRLYLAGAMNRFESGVVDVAQVLIEKR